MLDRNRSSTAIAVVLAVLVIGGMQIRTCQAEAVMGFAASLWGSVSATVQPALQWPMVLLKLGEKLPSASGQRTFMNPSCLIMMIVNSLIPNGKVQEQQPWSTNERAAMLFKSARAFNQEVWIGTRHREYLKTTERRGGMTVETTLSVVSCGRTGRDGLPTALIEAHGSGVNWFLPEFGTGTVRTVPCGSVRMPSWLLTKGVLNEQDRRRRQGFSNFTSSPDPSFRKTPYAWRAGIGFSSIWYSPFERVSILSNSAGWRPHEPPIRSSPFSKDQGVRGLNADYERRALLVQRSGAIVDGGINRIGFEWQESHFFIDYLEGMRKEACLDDGWGALCDNITAPQGTDSMHKDFAYLPWEDKWTFNVSSRESAANFCSNLFSDDVNEGVCKFQEREAWSANFSEIDMLERGDWDKKVDDGKYESRLENECPLNLILRPGNQSYIQLGRGNRFGDQHAAMLKDKARELQGQVYNRIPKDGIERTSTSTLLLTIITALEGILAAASWEITLIAANMILRVFSKRDSEKKMMYVKYLSLFMSFLFASAAILPGAFLLREELKKTRDVRVDADISFDASRRSNIEGDAFLGLIFVVTMEISDTSSRWKECTAIVSVVGFLAVLIVVKRIRNLKKSSEGRLKEAFVILGAVEP